MPIYKVMDQSQNQAGVLVIGKVALLDKVTKILEGDVQAPVQPQPQAKEGPVHKARQLFERMRGKPRKEILEAAKAMGLKASTTATQYQKWKHDQAQAQPQGDHTGAPTGATTH